MLYSGQKAFESFFKRHRFRRSKRIRTSFRASFIGRPRSAHRSTPTFPEASKSFNDNQKNENQAKPKRVKQIEIIKLDDDDEGTIIGMGRAPLSDSDNHRNLTNFPVAINNRKVYEQFSKYPVSKEKGTKSRPKTADTHKTNNCNKNLNNNLNNQSENNNTSITNILDLSCNTNHRSSIDTTMTDLLKNEVTVLNKEITKQRETIFILQDREKQMQHRLSEQARKQIEKGSTKFEDLSLGNNRPTQLIKRFGNLYSDSRVEALDALEEMAEIRECEDLKSKILLSIIVLSFRSTQKTLLEIKGKIRELLQFPKNTNLKFATISSAAKDLEEEVGVYLRKTVDRFNLKKNSAEVSEKIWSTLHDYPALKDCRTLNKYIEECVSMAWCLTVQHPPLLIDYEAGSFEANKHSRFHTSDPDSDIIKSCLWPALTEGERGVCVCKGIVLT